VVSVILKLIFKIKKSIFFCGWFYVKEKNWYFCFMKEKIKKYFFSLFFMFFFFLFLFTIGLGFVALAFGPVRVDLTLPWFRSGWCSVVSCMPRFPLVANVILITLLVQRWGFDCCWRMSLPGQLFSVKCITSRAVFFY